MPEYKKKKVRRMGAPRVKNKVRTIEHDDIEMKSSKPKKREQKLPNNSVRVITGKKLIRRRRMQTAAAVCVVLAIIISILQFLSPVGVLEVSGNLLKTIGPGSYPIELYGTAVLNSATKFNYYYVLTDLQLNAISAGGKEIYSVSHGFTSPIMKTSETRALIFDQNGSKLDIYNLNGLTSSVNTKNNILTAAIARNGTYAVVTEAPDYAASISVYDKNDVLLYEWYSAKDPVNNIAISPDGKKIAVTTLDASDGALHSKLLVLGFDSANPVYSTDFSNSVVYSLENSADGFVVSTAQSFAHITWDKYERKDYNSDRNLAFSRSTSSGTVLAFNRASNRADNHIVVFSKDGQKTAEFDFNGIISDIVMAKDHIYCISDTNVYFFDKQGNLLCSTPCGFGAARLAVISSNEVAVITNSEISRLELIEKGKK